MNKKLDVYLYSYKVGILTQDKHGAVSFQYTESWLNDPSAMSISHSLPLQQEVFKGNKCHSFFGGILPEAGKRETIARNLGISAKNDFVMLDHIGGECAGAITFIPAGASLPDQNHEYKLLSSSELANKLHELPKRPLLAGDDGIRLSLAGAQDKMVLFIKNSKMMLPINGAPSSHILKPAIAQFKDTVFNEAFCLNLANKLGISAANATVKKVGDIEYLLVERYDRLLDHNGNFVRLHQEDFCQALSIASENKYQKEGGPSFRQCFDLVREASSLPAVDTGRLINAVIFNYLIGNNDAHGKNFSLLYELSENGLRVRFSPLYDLVSTVTYKELSNNMAMKIGEQYIAEKVILRDWEKFAIDCDLTVPMVLKLIQLMAEKLRMTLEKHKILNETEAKIIKYIYAKCIKHTK